MRSKKQNNFIPPPDCIQIRGRRVIVRKAWEEIPRHAPKPVTAKQLHNYNNLKNNIPSGFCNRKIKAQIQKCSVNWLEAIRLKSLQSGKKANNYVTFVTLTLCCKQLHDDKYLNRHMLGFFIQKIQKKHGVTNYLWRAEKQKNGNIHYHIIIDRYIRWENIRMYWNAILRYHGYIQEYQKNMALFHKDGIRYRHDLAAKGVWSYEKQRKAYQYGVDTNWSDPNSTDIHKIENVEDLASYVAKYVSKQVEEVKQMEKAETDYNRGVIDYEKYSGEIARCKDAIEKSKVNSRIWGSSDKVKQNTDCKIVEHSDFDKLIRNIERDKETMKVVTEHCMIYYCKNAIKHIQQLSLFKDYQQHYSNLYTNLYSKNFHDLFSQEIPPPLPVLKEPPPQQQLVLELL